VRDRKSIAKKADAQGISPFFCCANAANGGSEPILLKNSLLRLQIFKKQKTVLR